MKVIVDVAAAGRSYPNSKWKTVRHGSLASLYVSGQLRDMLKGGDIDGDVNYNIAYLEYENEDIAQDSSTDGLLYVNLKAIKDKFGGYAVNDAEVTKDGYLTLTLGTKQCD